jgi:hypothetical protein
LKISKSRYNNSKRGAIKWREILLMF